MVIKEGQTYKYDNDIENSIGRVKPFTVTLVFI